MRFTQLAIGDRFEYQDNRYSKNGPLTAVNLANNQQRMIPRSALVSPVTGSNSATKHDSTASIPLDADTVAAAFELHHQACLQWLQQGDFGSEEIREQLEQARQQFLARCGLS